MRGESRAPRAPQLARLLARLRAVAAPVIQVWGPPGSGRAELLAALLESEGEGARALAPEAAGAEAVRAAVAEGARWIVVGAIPSGGEGAASESWAAAVARALPADRRLVFATRRRVPLPDALSDLVGPEELALRPDELVALAEAVGAPAPSPARAGRIVGAADGWYRPLRLAAEAAAEAGEEIPDTPEDLVALPAVARFLRRQGGDAFGDGGSDLDRARLLGALPADPAETGTFAPVDGAELPEAAPVEAVPEGVRFRVHLLGRPQAWRRDGGEWRRLHWPLKRAFRVLAYLASSPEHRAAREEMVEALWGDEPAGAVSRNFHPTLSHLRRGLREGAEEEGFDPLELVDGVYALDPALGWWTDLETLERLEAAGAEHAAAGRDEAAAAVWEAAWKLYRGHFLEGSYDPWVLQRREDHQRRYLRLLQGLAAARTRLGRAPAAVDAYRAVLVEDPLQEAAHLELMRLYARRGRRDLLRRQYERLTVLLREELGVEPLPETTREYHRLMTERATPSKAASGS